MVSPQNDDTRGGRPPPSPNNTTVQGIFTKHKHLNKVQILTYTITSIGVEAIHETCKTQNTQKNKTRKLDRKIILTVKSHEKDLKT